jgi:tetratricopeptide (TPR) repeat protein
MPLDSSHSFGQTVGAKLRAARLAKKYTQSQLAQPDFSVSYISAIERGQIQPSLRALEILARRLELNATDLLPLHGALIIDSPATGSAPMPEEERELTLLEAQIVLHQNNPERAIELLRSLLAKKGENQQDVALCSLLGQAYLESGSLQESEQFLAEAARQARETADPLYPHILSLQGSVYAAMRNTEQAVQLQRESQAFLEQSGITENIFFLAQMYASLGLSYSRQGQAEKALRMFEQALAKLRVRDSCQQLQSTYKDLARQYGEKEAPRLATLYTYKWLAADFSFRLPYIRSEIHHFLGRALLKERPDEAYSYLLTLFQEAGERDDRLTQASAAVHFASWFAARGELNKAATHAREAWELADTFGETLIGADALLLQGEIAYTQKEYEIGDQYFESGLAMLTHLGEEEELTEHLAHYARLLEERGSVEKAILYWKRAYQNRQKNWTMLL